MPIISCTELVIVSAITSETALPRPPIMLCSSMVTISFDFPAVLIIAALSIVQRISIENGLAKERSLKNA